MTDYGAILVEASSRGKTELVSLLLADKRMKLDEIHIELESIIERGYSEVVLLFIRDERLEVCEYSLLLAVKEGEIEVARALLEERRVDPTSVDYQGYNNNPIHIASPR